MYVDVLRHLITQGAIVVLLFIYIYVSYVMQDACYGLITYIDV